MWGRTGLAAIIVVAALMAQAAPRSAAADGYISLSGQITFDHADGFGSRGSAEYPMLETGDERLALVGVDAAEVEPGTRVRVLGRRQGPSFVVARDKGSLTVEPAPQTPRTQGDAEPTMSQHVAVLLINFVDEAWTTPTPAPPAEPWTKDMVRNLYFTGENSVAAYFAEPVEGHLAARARLRDFTRSVITLFNSNEWGAGAPAAANAGIDLSATRPCPASAPKAAVDGIAASPAPRLITVRHSISRDARAGPQPALTCAPPLRIPGPVASLISLSCPTDEYATPSTSWGTPPHARCTRGIATSSGS